MLGVLHTLSNGRTYTALRIMSLSLGLAAIPAHAGMVQIPYAPSVNVSSVELWKKCQEGDPGINAGCLDRSSRKLSIKSLLDVLQGKAKKQPNKSALSGQSLQTFIFTDNGSPITVTSSAPSSVQAPLSSIEEKVVSGMTDFLVARAKQEARLYLEDLLFSDLCPDGKNSNNNKRIFKNTCNVLVQLHNGTYSMSGVASMLRAAIRKDLENYPEYRFSNADKLDVKRKWLYAMITMAMYQESRSNRDISELIGGLSNISDLMDSICPRTPTGSNGQCEGDLEEVAEKARLYWYLSENYRALHDYLVQSKKFDSTDKTLVALYVVSSALHDDPDTRAIDVGKIRKASDVLSNITSAFEVIQSYREQVKELEANADPSTTEDANLALRLHAFFAGLDTLVRIEHALCDVPNACSSNERRMQVVQDASDIADAAVRKDYPRLVMEVVAFAQDDQGDLESNRYLPLLAELASTQSSADVQKIFEAAAEPARSYREKFKSGSLMTITALAGAAYTKEFYVVDSTTKATNNAWQPFLPVGLQQTCQVKYGALGVFVSLIDVGTLAMSRSSDGLATGNSNTGFAQIFSPGLFFTHNIPGSPFVWGFGRARTPKLVTTANGIQTSSMRNQVFIALDLTLFSFR